MNNTPPEASQRRLVACLAVVNPKEAWRAHTYASVADAVFAALNQFQDRPFSTALVAVSDVLPGSTEEASLIRRSKDLVRAINKPGLFVTLAVQDVVRDLPIDDVRFEDFGTFSSNPEDRSERLFALIHPNTPHPTRDTKVAGGNCPAPTRSFVGRQIEMDDLQGAVLEHKVVTVVGPPGAGKSTLALHVLRRCFDEMPDGVWAFSAENCGSASELLQRIADEPGLINLSGEVTSEIVAREIGKKNAIILLDGCQKLTEDLRPLCSSLLATDSKATVILTSTKATGVCGEFIFPLGPLRMPTKTDSTDDLLFTNEAVRVFLARAEEAGALLPQNDRTLLSVARICQQLDGLPLPIELTASTLRFSSLAAIETNLSNESSLAQTHLGEDAPEVNPMHAFYKASYRVLSEYEQDSLQLLACYQTEWKLPAASLLWKQAGKLGEGLASLHRSLVEQSWLAYLPDRDCYRLLRPLRGFLRSIREPDHRSRLLSAYANTVSQLPAYILTSVQSATEREQWIDRHYQDSISVFELALDEPGFREHSSTLLPSLLQQWLRRNLLFDAERFSQRFLATDPGGVDAVRANMMMGIVRLRRRQLDEAATSFEQARDTAQAINFPVGKATALTNLGLVMTERARYEEGQACHEEAAGLFRKLKDTARLANSLCNAADAIAKSVSGTGVLLSPGKAKDARKFLNEAQEIILEQPDALIAQALWHNFGALSQAEGALVDAERFYRRAATECEAHGLVHEAAQGIRGLAEIALIQGHAATAAKLLGLCVRIKQDSGKPPTPREFETTEKLLVSLTDQLGQDRCERLMRYGAKLALSEITDQHATR